MIELLSIDLTNHCTKQCPFCYNYSGEQGHSLWQPSEVIDFAKDCIVNGVKAISLGGGEPFEYEGIFQIIEELYPLCYLSITSNGLPLNKSKIINSLKINKPDKIHLSIHFPESTTEVERVEKQLELIKSLDIKPGINLLVSKKNIQKAKDAYETLSKILTPDQIIIIPLRFSNTPSPTQLTEITKGRPFQSPSCLLGCKKPDNFCSVTWDKKVNWCSFAKEKVQLGNISYKGLVDSLKQIKFIPCYK